MNSTVKLGNTRRMVVESNVIGATDYTFFTLKPNGASVGDVVTLSDTNSDGKYYGDFTPDELGVWVLTLQKDGVDVDGVIPLRIDVVEYDINDVYDSVAVVDGVVDDIKIVVDSNATKIDTIDGIVDDIKLVADSNAVKLDTIDGIVDDIKLVADTNATKIDTIDGVVDSNSTKLDAIDTTVTNVENILASMPGTASVHIL